MPESLPAREAVCGPTVPIDAANESTDICYLDPVKRVREDADGTSCGPRETASLAATPIAPPPPFAAFQFSRGLEESVRFKGDASMMLLVALLHPDQDLPYTGSSPVGDLQAEQVELQGSAEVARSPSPLIKDTLAEQADERHPDSAEENQEEEDGLTEYERKRLENIRRNRAVMMEMLGQSELFREAQQGKLASTSAGRRGGKSKKR